MPTHAHFLKSLARHQNHYHGGLACRLAGGKLASQAGLQQENTGKKLGKYNKNKKTIPEPPKPAQAKPAWSTRPGRYDVVGSLHMLHLPRLALVPGLQILQPLPLLVNPSRSLLDLERPKLKKNCKKLGKA